MNSEINYKHNPLHGLGLKELLEELVDHYGYEILFAYLNIKCFKERPSIDSSVKFLKKTDWAREKVEAFYLYQLKSLPRASAEQFELPPRDRIIPEDQFPGEPAELSLEDAARLREKRGRKAKEFGRGDRAHSERGRANNEGRSTSPYRKTAKPSAPESGGDSTPPNPWGNWKG